jgi:hypothetical protein
MLRAKGLVFPLPSQGRVFHVFLPVKHNPERRKRVGSENTLHEEAVPTRLSSQLSAHQNLSSVPHVARRTFRCQLSADGDFKLLPSMSIPNVNSSGR